MNQKPSVGRIVHYFLREGAPAEAAIVTKVHSDTCVNLSIFVDGGVVSSRTSCNYSELPDKGDVGTWCWPPRI